MNDMPLYDCLKAWSLINIQLARGTGIILHTSCVNYRMDDLKEMFSLGMKVILPNDVFFELRLMTKSAVFGEKAAYIIRKVRPQPEGRLWDLSQLYMNCSRPVSYPEIHRGPLLFIFGDLNKTDEFLEHSVPGRDAYVLLPPFTWSCNKGKCLIMPLNSAKRIRTRKVKPLTMGRPIGKLSEARAVYRNRNKEDAVYGNQFVSTGKCGSNAYIYRCSALPNTLIKGYKNLSREGAQKEKLQLMQKFGAKVPGLNCAFPIDLLYINPSSIAGYSMKPVAGRLLREYLEIGWGGHDLGKILEDLFLILLELHTMHIIVNDLSFNNVLIDDMDRVGLVDCDSFQITSYPGGGITRAYQHPEISDQDFSKKLREPRHEYFALAVLLFQIMFFDDPLRQVQSADDETELSWDKVTFPLLPDAWSDRANQEIQNNWFDQPAEIRRAFFDEFTFKTDLSIGSWIRILGIAE